MSAAPGVRYPVRLVMRARELRAAGWTLRAIAGLVEEETGTRPSHNTVWRWTDDEGRQRNNDLTKANSRARRHRTTSTGRHGGAPPSDEFKILRARALRAHGVGLPDLARVMDFDYGDGLTAHQWRWVLQAGHFPRPYTRRAAA